MKHKVAYMRCLLYGINNKLDSTERRIGEFIYISIEIMQTKAQKKRSLKKWTELQWLIKQYEMD